MFFIRFHFCNGKIGHISAVSLNDAMDKANFFQSINDCITEFHIFDPNFKEVC